LTLKKLERLGTQNHSHWKEMINVPKNKFIQMTIHKTPPSKSWTRNK
jgi:hypothetical protein